MADETPPTAPAAPGTPSTPPGVPSEPAATWYGNDTEIAGYLQNRNLADKPVEDVARAAIKSHQEAQKFIGAPETELVRLPKDANDADGWNKVWTRLGRPAEASGYDVGDLATREELKDFVEAVKPTLLKHGVPKAMGEALIRDIAEYTTKRGADETVAKQAAVQVERDALRKELGQNYDINMAVARRAAAALGVTPEAVSALESTVGYSQVMKMFMNIGSKIGEDKFITSEHTGGVVTKEAAKDRIASLKADQTWVKAYLNGDSQKVKEMHDLQIIVAGGDDTEASRARSGR